MKKLIALLLRAVADGLSDEEKEKPPEEPAKVGINITPQKPSDIEQDKPIAELPKENPCFGVYL